MPTLPLPRSFDFLFQPSRYKVVHGGRGKGASWSFARTLIALSIGAKQRMLCCREIQASIKDSVQKLLAEQIDALGLSDKFTVHDRSITNTIGSEFLFEGLFRNVNRIKSMEGIDKAWVEEAEMVSAESWDILTPTIRKPGSEIWVNFNPSFEDDATYQKFVAHPPDNAVVRQINYMDNPFFPEVLRLEMEQDKARDRSLYEHKWLGKPHGSGRKIWTAFDKDAHVRDIPMEAIAKVGNAFMSMDPHSKYYPFCLWVAVLPKNDRRRWPEDFYKHVYAEWPTFEDLGGYYHDLRHKLFYTDTIKDMAREMQAKDGSTHGIQVRARFIDTRFAKGAGGSNWSTSTEGVVSQFAKRENGGLLFQMPKERIIDIQRDVIHTDMLFNKLQSRSQFNEPSFSVSPSCRNLIASLTNHRLEEDSEKESEKYKDPSDALRINWAGFSNMEWEDPNGIKEEPGATTIAAGRGYW